jgi:hypothetical protein
MYTNPRAHSELRADAARVERDGVIARLCDFVLFVESAKLYPESACERDNADVAVPATAARAADMSVAEMLYRLIGAIPVSLLGIE